MPWNRWKKGDKNKKTDADSSLPETSTVDTSSNPLASVTDIISATTPSPSGSALIDSSETADTLQTSSNTAALLPIASEVAPVAHLQAMFPQVTNAKIGKLKAVFHMYGSSPPPSGSANIPDSSVCYVATNSHSGSSRASSADLDLPTEPIPTPKTGPEIYVRHLITKNRGYPLWIPSPNRRLPATYRASGVGFGDVGILIPEGGFSFLFNVVHDATHPINASRRLPEGFAPFTAWNAYDVEEYEEFSAGSYLATESLVCLGSGDDMAKTTLKSSAAEAAVLMMPEPVYLTMLQNTASLRKYVHDNIKTWYKFVKIDLGREINNGEVRVVYGCRKSAGFGIATVPTTESANASTELTFTTNGITGCKYRWQHKGSAEVKAGPSLVDSQDILAQRGIPDTAVHATVINQCLFVSTIDFTFPEDEWRSITPGDPVITSQESSNSQSKLSPPSHPTSSYGRATSDWSNSNISQQGQDPNTSRPQDTSTPITHDKIEAWPSIIPSKRIFHPSDIITDFLLKAFPHVTSVSLCSDDWGPATTGSVDTVAALISNVLSLNDICQDNGMIYLKASNHGVVLNHLEHASPSAIQWLWTQWHDQHYLSLVWSKPNGEPDSVLTPGFPAFVVTRLAEWNVILSPWMLNRTFPTTARPSHIRTKTVKLSQEGTDGSFVGRFTLAALSEMHCVVTFRRAPDGGYILHGDAFGDSVSPTLTRAGLTTSQPFPNRRDPAPVDFRAFYPYTPNDVKHRKRTTLFQLKTLENTFKTDAKPNAILRGDLAQQLEMTPRGVQVWFQNRRAKEKTKASKQKAVTASQSKPFDEASWRFSFDLNSSQLLGLDAGLPSNLNKTLTQPTGQDLTQVEEPPFRENVEQRRSMSGRSPHLLGRPPQDVGISQNVAGASQEVSSNTQNYPRGELEAFFNRTKAVNKVDGGVVLLGHERNGPVAEHSAFQEANNLEIEGGFFDLNASRGGNKYKNPRLQRPMAQDSAQKALKIEVQALEKLSETNSSREAQSQTNQ